MQVKKIYYKVKRFWQDSSESGNWHYYKSHTFDTYEEVEKYIETHIHTYRLEITKIEETDVKILDPIYDSSREIDEESVKFLEGLVE
jgi:hypothetical protein